MAEEKRPVLSLKRKPAENSTAPAEATPALVWCAERRSWWSRPRRPGRQRKRNLRRLNKRPKPTRATLRRRRIKR
ncbi:hypothetical protein F7P09_26210 (plasmid) [Klebsiella pneumoniae]|nr:hypothetical protein F7P09_26210 [Klebsiella pneumoniae]